MAMATGWDLKVKLCEALEGICFPWYYRYEVTSEKTLILPQAPLFCAFHPSLDCCSSSKWTEM